MYDKVILNQHCKRFLPPPPCFIEILNQIALALSAMILKVLMEQTYIMHTQGNV